MFVIPLHIMGVNCRLVACRDMGTFVSLVNKAFVDSSAYTGDVMEVSGIFEPPIKIPRLLYTNIYSTLT
jgi:hypothetical protein